MSSAKRRPFVLGLNVLTHIPALKVARHLKWFIVEDWGPFIVSYIYHDFWWPATTSLAISIDGIDQIARNIF